MSQTRTVRFVELLGSGGFGDVYLVEVSDQQQFIQRMALKLLREDVKSPKFIARLRDEARLLAKLNHDNIVKVYHLSSLLDRPAIFMEHIPGIDLDTLLQVDTIPPRAALQMAASAAAALHAAHTAISPQSGEPLSVIHRDIKPANLLLTQYGHLKTLDFGIAKANFDREATTRSFRMGTPRYMSPERWLDLPLSDRVDVYALGVTLYEMLTHSPMPRTQIDSQLHAKSVEMALQSLSSDSLPESVCLELHGLLTATLAFDPTLRPTAGHFSDALFRLADQIPGDDMRTYAAKAVQPLIQARRIRNVTRQLPSPKTVADFSIEPLSLSVNSDISFEGGFSPDADTVETAPNSERQEFTDVSLIQSETKPPQQPAPSPSFDVVDASFSAPSIVSHSHVAIQWISFTLTLAIIGPLVFFMFG